MALPNLWGLYNLRSSPFFQATLRADSEATPAPGRRWRFHAGAAYLMSEAQA